jgi:hypothetical protein
VIADLEPVGRRSDGELGNSTVLVSTCKSRAINAQRCLAAACNGHLERPLARGRQTGIGTLADPPLAGVPVRAE